MFGSAECNEIHIYICRLVLVFVNCRNSNPLPTVIQSNRKNLFCETGDAVVKSFVKCACAVSFFLIPLSVYLEVTVILIVQSLRKVVQLSADLYDDLRVSCLIFLDQFLELKLSNFVSCV